MYFLRVDYLPKTGGGVVRIRSLHNSMHKAVKAFQNVLRSTDCVILCRIELCGV